MKENKNIEMLNYVYQNARMGVEGIEHILDQIETPKFKKVIEHEQKEYKRLAKEAKNLLEKQENKVKELGMMKKINSYLMAKMNTLTDHSESHIAEMMMQGSNMGIIEISKHLNEYHDLDPEVLDLTNDLLKTEQFNVEELKQYL